MKIGRQAKNERTHAAAPTPYLSTGVSLHPERASPTQSSELVFAVRLDGHVGRRVRHAGKAETLLHLVVVQERLVRLVDGALHDLARAAGAGASAAGIGQLDALLLRLVQDVRVLRALELLRALGGLQGDLEVGGHAAARG